MDLDRGQGCLPPSELAQRIGENLLKRCENPGHYATSCPWSNKTRQRAAVAEQEGVPLDNAKNK